MTTANGAGAPVHSRLSHPEISHRPRPVMKMSTVVGGGGGGGGEEGARARTAVSVGAFSRASAALLPNASALGAPKAPGGIAVMSARCHEHRDATSGPIASALRSHRSRHSASISTPTHRHPYRAHASSRTRPSPHPRSQSTDRSSSRAAAKTCARREAAHGANGETERGPACDHGSSVSRSAVRTYRRARALCSASHRSSPVPVALRSEAGEGAIAASRKVMAQRKAVGEAVPAPRARAAGVNKFHWAKSTL